MTILDEEGYLIDEQVIARALFKPQWDDEVNRGTPSSFEKNNTSVTFFGEIKLDDVISLLKNDVEKSGRKVVKGIGIIRVKRLRFIGENLEGDRKIIFRVKGDPTQENKNHAEIIPYSKDDKVLNKVSRSVCRTIADSLLVVVLDPSGKPESCSRPTVLPKRNLTV